MSGLVGDYMSLRMNVQSRPYAKQNRFRIERLVNLVYLNTPLGAVLPQPRTPFKIFVNSVPKSGTNLLMKTLRLFPTVRDSKISLHSEMVGTPWRPTQPLKQRTWRLFPSVRATYELAKMAVILQNVSSPDSTYAPIGGFHNLYVPGAALEGTLAHVRPRWFSAGHMPFSRVFDRILRDLQFKMVLIVRDPRDLIYSELKFFLNTKRLALHDYYRQLSVEQGLTSIIQGVTPGPSSPSQPGIRELLQGYLPWCSLPYVLLTRFEDLVGPQGGGDAQAQRREITRIADHLEISLTFNEITHVADNLFGGTHTFRKGVIGSWKEAFKPEHRSAVKEHIGDLLVELGYEDSTDW